eukprot:COSAG01_NODE_44692_length_416_cov_1.365931_1_plen_52_part_10
MSETSTESVAAQESRQSGSLQPGWLFPEDHLALAFKAEYAILIHAINLKRSA